MQARPVCNMAMGIQFVERQMAVLLVMVVTGLFAKGFGWGQAALESVIIVGWYTAGGVNRERTLCHKLTAKLMVDKLMCVFPLCPPAWLRATHHLLSSCCEVLCRNQVTQG